MTTENAVYSGWTRIDSLPLAKAVEAIEKRFDELVESRPHTGRTTKALAASASYREWATFLAESLQVAGLIASMARSALTKAQRAGQDVDAARTAFERAEAASHEIEAMHDKEVRFI